MVEKAPTCTSGGWNYRLGQLALESQLQVPREEEQRFGDGPYLLPNQQRHDQDQLPYEENGTNHQCYEYGSV